MSHFKLLVFCLCFFYNLAGHSQELFVYSEPASNMPTGSTGVRLTNWLMRDDYAIGTGYQLMPEVMFGLSKRAMLHAEAFISNADNTWAVDGAGAYFKYRFLSVDGMHKHFRMAAFGRASTSNIPIRGQDINLFGRSTGYNAGLVATQLLQKTAISATAYYEQAYNNGKHEDQKSYSKHAANYIISAGHLVLPKHYKNYRQTNMNLMLEVPFQIVQPDRLYYIDVAASVQFIFNSQTRVDIGYRREVDGNMYRPSANGMLLRIEHLFFKL